AAGDVVGFFYSNGTLGYGPCLTMLGDPLCLDVTAGTRRGRLPLPRADAGGASQLVLAIPAQVALDDYVFQAVAWSAADGWRTAAPVSLSVVADVPDCEGDDALEPNDTAAGASPIG